MFIGHFAIGFGVKKVEPRINLGTLFFAVQFLDLLWPVLLLAGIEHVRLRPDALPFLRLDFFDYPLSHSLMTSLIWSILIGFIYYLLKKSVRNSFIIGCAVFSHWLLDFISHAPDLPLAPGFSPVLGMGLWNSTPATLIVESTLFFLGIFLYVHTTKAINMTGVISFWSLIAFLAIVYLASTFGSPPPNVRPIGWMGLSLWLLIPWGYWIDRNRAGKDD